jgi:hypothetical protein
MFSARLNSPLDTQKFYNSKYVNFESTIGSHFDKFHYIKLVLHVPGTCCQLVTETICLNVPKPSRQQPLKVKLKSDFLTPVVSLLKVFQY